MTTRRKADLECGNDAARKADLALPTIGRRRAMGARKANELKKEQKAGRWRVRCSKSFGGETGRTAITGRASDPEREAFS
jgi:hypothetical protein